MSGIVLETRDLTRDFGGLRAVDRVNLRVEEGTVHAVIGPNGAGKTTLFNLIGGSLRPTLGRVFYRGRDITGLPPYGRARLGIGRTYQITHVFPELTVLENVRLAAQALGPDNLRFWVPASGLRHYLDRAREVLDRVGLAAFTDLPARTLPHGQRRWLELAMLLAQDPDLMLLDEPAAGLAAEQLPALVSLVDEARRRQGRTILLIEHKVDLVLRLADRVTVMHRGRILAEGPPAAVVADEGVQNAYLGEREWQPFSSS